MTKTIQIVQLDAFVFRAPITEPRRNAFGLQRDRPSMLVRMIDQDGVEGWGEAFCNWPPVAAEHRARLVNAVFRPLLVGHSFTSPEEMFNSITHSTARMRLQSDERGPFDQVISALDIAAWDIFARRLSLPLCQALNSEATGERTLCGIEIYSSGLSPTTADRLTEVSVNRQIHGIKVKVGFSKDEDLACLKRLRTRYQGNRFWN